MKKIVLSLLLLISYSASQSQNVGIGVANPQQKLHVGGNVRVDGFAAPGNGLITTNTSGDLLRINFTGNSNDVLKGDGSFGASVSSSLPTGAIVGSRNSVDSNLLNGGFSFYGEMPNNIFTYIQRPGGISTQYLELPTYNNGAPGAQLAPSPRSLFTSAWSGSEMLIWGGVSVSDSNTYDFLNNGKKYNPASDTWSPISGMNAPRKRAQGSTVWTGAEMIVWGGIDSLVAIISPVQYFFTNTGGKYNPATNTWTAMNQAGPPTARYGAPAVWTGTYMVIWGGARDTGHLSTGSRYNPTGNSWHSITVAGAPVSAGENTKMFWDAGSGYVVVLGKDNTGGRYNPVTNTWAAMANCPVNYDRHSAVWTGTQLMVYSRQTHTMYKYSPATNLWTTVVTAGNFPDNNINFMDAVWTGFEIVYFVYHYDPEGNITGNRLYRYNNGTNSFTYHVVQYNSLIDGGNNFLAAGSMILKWGGEMGQANYGVSEYRQSSQGFRYYLNAGIAYPPYYPKSSVNRVIYMYKKD